MTGIFNGRNSQVSSGHLILPRIDGVWLALEAFFLRAIRYPLLMAELTNTTLRELKARAQLLKPTLKVGKDGLSPQFIAEVDQTLKHLELIKVKFDSFKEEKKELALQLAGRTSSHIVTRVGHVVVLFRPKPRGPEAAADESAE